ncbi:MAG: undecaprenyl-diphosphatase UppP [Chloroflexi bacterium]|nr:undecaprenyl-diphosphatase UppP [Chloroflexota bacterium]
MTNLFQALVLGIVQGATEFIPVSSSGHLVLLPWLLSWPNPTLAFDTTLHLGTLVAVLLHFQRDFRQLIRAWVRSLQTRDPSSPEARLAWFLILGTIPAAVLGALFESRFEQLFGSPHWVALLLIVTGTLLALAEWSGRQSRDAEELDAPSALLIGIGQAMAIAPGISRTGATMSVGLLCGLKREAAARFSFLLATPIILGAGAKQLLDLMGESNPLRQAPSLMVGFVAALCTGYFCIRFLLGYLRTGRLYIFSVYCWAMGVIGLILTRP